MPAYLADTSIWVWAKRWEPTRRRLESRVAAGDVVTCVPVAIEVLHSARDGAEYEASFVEFAALGRLPLTPPAAERALEMQRELAHTTHGAHRLPAVDYLVAAIVESAPQVVLWHVDRDLGRLCDAVGVEHEQERIRKGSGN